MLKVTIISFSYKTTPLWGGAQESEPFVLEHGGGFVFDCRALPNPGREARFVDKTGLDDSVKEYLAAVSEVNVFLESTCSLVTLSIRNFVSRSFDSLFVGFGCTGGQHRSVYCAERVASLLRNSFDTSLVTVAVSHPELTRRGFL